MILSMEVTSSDYCFRKITLENSDQAPEKEIVFEIGIPTPGPLQTAPASGKAGRPGRTDGESAGEDSRWNILCVFVLTNAHMPPFPWVREVGFPWESSVINGRTNSSLCRGILGAVPGQAVGPRDVQTRLLFSSPL